MNECGCEVTQAGAMIKSKQAQQIQLQSGNPSHLNGIIYEAIDVTYLECLSFKDLVCKPYNLQYLLSTCRNWDIQEASRREMYYEFEL